MYSVPFSFSSAASLRWSVWEIASWSTVEQAAIATATTSSANGSEGATGETSTKGRNKTTDNTLLLFSSRFILRRAWLSHGVRGSSAVN